MKTKQLVIENGTIIAHNFSSACGSNYDVQLIVYKKALFINNKKTGEFGAYDELKEYYEFNINNEPDYRFSEEELINLAC
jgi:hypothetical protein